MVFQKGFLLRYALVFAMSLNLVTLGCAPSAHAEVVSTAAFNPVVDAMHALRTSTISSRRITYAVSSLGLALIRRTHKRVSRR